MNLLFTSRRGVYGEKGMEESGARELRCELGGAYLLPMLRTTVYLFLCITWLLDYCGSSGFPVVCSCIGLGGINLAVIIVQELRLFLYGLSRFYYLY